MDEQLTEEEYEIAIDSLDIMIQKEPDPDKVQELVTQREQLRARLADMRSEQFAGYGDGY